VQNLTKLASILEGVREGKQRGHQKLVLLHARLDLADDTKGLFKVMTKRFCHWLKDPNDTDYPPEVKWIKAGNSNNHNLLPEELRTETDVSGLVKAAAYSRDRAFLSML